MARPLFAFPNKEKAALALLGSQATSFLIDGDRFIYAASGSTISRIDTQTFDLATDQVPALTDNSGQPNGQNLTGDVGGMTIRGTSLFASQSDGDLLTIDLNSITSEPTSVHVVDGGQLGPLVADPNNNQLFILDAGHNAVQIFDTSTKTATAIPLVDGFGSPVSPKDIAFVSSTSGPKEALVTSESGLIFAIAEGATSVSGTITIGTNKKLESISVTPDAAFALVADATDNVVHVIDTATNTEVDTDPVTTGVNPIALTQNSNLNHVLVTPVDNPTDVYAYVSGTNGLSVIDLNESTAGFQQPTVIDFNNTGSGDTAADPMTTSSIPGPLAASSASDGYVYSVDSNASMSVITEKPFVQISGTSLGSSSLGVSGTFNVTFQCDETGTYQVLIGGDQTANGTSLTSGTVDTAGTPVTTSDIAFDASLFQEGTNRVFVFVTDSSGLVGRDAIDITVNTPPQGVEIIGTDFGDGKIFVTISRLTANDIDHYNFYVDPDPNVVATSTTPTGTIPQTSSGDTITTKISKLTNGLTYFIGIEGVDTAGNIGTRTTTLQDGTPAQATPQATFGLVEATGETGCALIKAGEKGGERGLREVWFALPLLLLGLLRKRMWRRLLLSTLVVLPSAILLLTATASAEEPNPQWFSLEFKGGVWIPTNHTTRDFLGTISPTGKVEFGFLYHSRYGAELGVGYIGAGGTAIGSSSGSPSGDHFSFLMIPIENSFAFRAAFRDEQLLVPYVKAGPDYVIFRQGLSGHATSGVKYGLHGTLGLQILLDNVDEGLSKTLLDAGINHIYFTVEGRYGWINSFGKTGVDLSGLTATGGILFEF